MCLVKSNSLLFQIIAIKNNSERENNSNLVYCAILPYTLANMRKFFIYPPSTSYILIEHLLCARQHVFQRKKLVDGKVSHFP